MLTPANLHAELQMSHEDIFLIAILVGNDYDKVRVVIYTLGSTDNLCRKASKDVVSPWRPDSHRAASGAGFLQQSIRRPMKRTSSHSFKPGVDGCSVNFQQTLPIPLGGGGPN